MESVRLLTDSILEVLIESTFVEINEVFLAMQSHDCSNLFDGLRGVLEREASAPSSDTGNAWILVYLSALFGKRSFVLRHSSCALFFTLKKSVEQDQWYEANDHQCQFPASGQRDDQRSDCGAHGLKDNARSSASQTLDAARRSISQGMLLTFNDEASDDRRVTRAPTELAS